MPAKVPGPLQDESLREALHVRLDAADLTGEAGLARLEELLTYWADSSDLSLRVLTISGDAPVLDPAALDAGARRALLAWGGRLAAASLAPGGLRIGWADGEVRGPALELLLGCDVMWLGDNARLYVFPAAEGYFPVGGSWTRALARAGSGRLLPACLEGHPLFAAQAVQCGLAAGTVSRADLEAAVRRVSSADPRALAAVADLARRAPGLGGRQAEVLERAVFSWCFARGELPEAIRAYRVGDRDEAD